MPYLMVRHYYVNILESGSAIAPSIDLMVMSLLREACGNRGWQPPQELYQIPRQDWFLLKLSSHIWFKYNDAVIQFLQAVIVHHEKIAVFFNYFYWNNYWTYICNYFNVYQFMHFTYLLVYTGVILFHLQLFVLPSDPPHSNSFPSSWSNLKYILWNLSNILQDCMESNPGKKYSW